jgi:hypothetical protein
MSLRMDFKTILLLVKFGFGSKIMSKETESSDGIRDLVGSIEG